MANSASAPVRPTVWARAAERGKPCERVSAEVDEELPDGCTLARRSLREGVSAGHYRHQPLQHAPGCHHNIAGQGLIR